MDEPQKGGAFRILTNEEFSTLRTEEKVEYLKRAVKAQKLLTDLIAEGLAKMLPSDKPPET